MKKMYKDLTWENGYEVHLGLTGDRKAVVPQEIANNQKKYDGKTFKALLSDGNWMRVKLVGDDYGLNASGTGDIIIRPMGYYAKRTSLNTFLVVTDNGNIITGDVLKGLELWDRDQIVTEQDINDLVETEMDPNSHDDSEYYETSLEFYTSNAKKESYCDYIAGRLDTVSLTPDALVLIQDEVIARIEAENK